jgi:hypothetical protein
VENGRSACDIFLAFFHMVHRFFNQPYGILISWGYQGEYITNQHYEYEFVRKWGKWQLYKMTIEEG